MSTKVIMGAQWGDEGKGKITDIFAQDADMVVRYAGGNNAGHTIVVENQTYALHLIPSGILKENVINVIGNGVVVNLAALVYEMQKLKEKDISLKNLVISDRAHIIMPYHIMLDKCQEEAKKENKVGTTRKGIGPAYEEKCARTSIRMVDLLDESRLRNKIIENTMRYNLYFKKIYEKEPLDVYDIVNETIMYAREIKSYITDTSILINNAIKKGKNIVFEGAQSAMLDIDYGSYPYVTSSNSGASGVSHGAGIGPNEINEVYGIAKAYTTRVGEGPFPTEQDNEIGKQIREEGNEYGVTTGRARRCGYLDIVPLKLAIRTNGITKLIINRLDTIACLDEVKICTGYIVNGKLIDEWPADLSILENAKPIYLTFDGWTKSLSNYDNYESMPTNLKRYVEAIETFCKCKVAFIGTGPTRKDIIRK